MKPLIFIFLLFSLVGCDSFKDITKSVKQTETLDHKLNTTDKGNNSYSGDPLEPINVTASGNTGPIIIHVGEKAKVEKNEKRDTATEEEIESTFSVDSYLRSIPTTGWALILFLLIVMLICAWIFFKTTIAGRAFDAGIAKAIEITSESIDVVRDKLADASKGSELHSELQAELARLRFEEGKLKEKAKAKK